MVKVIVTSVYDDKDVFIATKKTVKIFGLTVLVKFIYSPYPRMGEYNFCARI